MARPPLSSGPMRPPRDLSALTGDPGAQAHPAAIASVGGALLFELKAAQAGVHVIRVHRRDDGTKLYFSVLFDD